MKNKIIICLLVQFLCFKRALSTEQGFKVSAKIAHELVQIKWDIETSRATAKAIMNYGRDYSKHLGSVKVATGKLSRELKIPTNLKDLLNKIRLELLTKANKITDQANSILDKKLSKQAKEINTVSNERQSLWRKMRDCEKEKAGKLTKEMSELARKAYELKTRVLKTLKVLLDLKYEILNLEFADSIEKYSREYKKFLIARDKQKKTSKKAVNKKVLTITTKPHSVKPMTKPSTPASSQGYKNYKIDSINWAAKLTNELEKELTQTSKELAQMSDRLTKELSDLERMGIELFGAHQAFVV